MELKVRREASGYLARIRGKMGSQINGKYNVWHLITLAFESKDEIGKNFGLGLGFVEEDLRDWRVMLIVVRW